MDAMLLEPVQSRDATDKVAPPLPRAAVVVPTYHRPELLARYLRAYAVRI